MAHCKPLWTSLSMHEGSMEKPSWICVIPLSTSLDHYILLRRVVYDGLKGHVSFVIFTRVLWWILVYTSNTLTLRNDLVWKFNRIIFLALSPVPVLSIFWCDAFVSFLVWISKNEIDREHVLWLINMISMWPNQHFPLTANGYGTELNGFPLRPQQPLQLFQKPNL